MTWLADQLDTLGPAMEAVAGEEVTYRRGSQTVRQLTATPAATDANLLVYASMVIETEIFQDMIVNHADLGGLTPSRGDRITRPSGEELEVVAIGSRTYRHTTSSRKRLRVHCKRVN